MESTKVEPCGVRLCTLPEHDCELCLYFSKVDDDYCNDCDSYTNPCKFIPKIELQYKPEDVSFNTGTTAQVEPCGKMDCPTSVHHCDDCIYGEVDGDSCLDCGGAYPCKFIPKETQEVKPPYPHKGCEADDSVDMVNKPPHYNQGNIEVIDFIEDQKLEYHAGNVVKYVSRYKHKNGIEDLKKAAWYLQRLINKEAA